MIPSYSRRKALLVGVATCLCFSSHGVAVAMSTIPDNPSLFSSEPVVESPRITVTDEAGKPLRGPVHRGDVIVVHGTGFSSHANRGGFPIPIPPGVPNGVYAVYSAFPDVWKPSEGAPSSARKHPHNRMAWVMPDGTLDAIPTIPFDFRRSIARESQRMNPDGSFHARLVVDPPETVPGKNWGVYVYAAAGSVNPAEEFYVPIPYSPEPGPNTPAAPTPDLRFSADLLKKITTAAGGGIALADGTLFAGNDVAFSKNEAQSNDGIIRFRGTITATAKYNVVEIAAANPWLEPRGNGTWALTLDISTSANVGKDVMQRREVGIVHGIHGVQDVFAGPIAIGKIALS